MENPSLKTRIFKATISSNTSVGSNREVRVETQNFKRKIKRKNPSRNPDLKKIKDKMENPSLKTRIFKATIGSNTSVGSKRKSESEPGTSNER